MMSWEEENDDREARFAAGPRPASSLSHFLPCGKGVTQREPGSHQLGGRGALRDHHAEVSASRVSAQLRFYLREPLREQLRRPSWPWTGWLPVDAIDQLAAQPAA